MTVELRFSAYGPVRLWRDSREVPAGSPQQQALLAALMLVQGRQLPVEELIRVLWHDDPPRAALSTVRTYLSRLRRWPACPADGLRRSASASSTSAPSPAR
ncbi:winged helix-turn-helix domain-containing protein [Actinoplanes sp. M2I2]|uniref:AfsR/SARP family transcriptional regulator n=1 Tax=Actinoplanes sp. M2I2 TaxID=1734444 RepID=UPI0020223BD0|nr:winged helix-turn-helix domain-containing protein [Actinoplanes sp. M2I2]